LKTKHLINRNQKTDNYLRNEIMSMTPVQLVTKVYDLAILNCKKKDMVKASKAIVELISALKFEYEEISISLFQLYQYCLDQIKKEEYDDAIDILTGLRESWVEAAKNN